MRLIVLNEQMEESIEKIEAVISNLARNSEDLSDIVAAQDKEISRIKDNLQSVSYTHLTLPTKRIV